MDMKKMWVKEIGVREVLGSVVNIIGPYMTIQ
jgi:hypothetical protein